MFQLFFFGLLENDICEFSLFRDQQVENRNGADIHKAFQPAFRQEGDANFDGGP